MKGGALTRLAPPAPLARGALWMGDGGELRPGGAFQERGRPVGEVCPGPGWGWGALRPAGGSLQTQTCVMALGERSALVLLATPAGRVGVSPGMSGLGTFSPGFQSR